MLYRVRRLPDDVRVVGDKALFDRGMFGQRQVKGYDLEELGRSCDTDQLDIRSPARKRNRSMKWQPSPTIRPPPTSGSCVQ